MTKQMICIIRSSFLSHISSSITYTPAMLSEGWFATRDLHNITVQLFINGVVPGDVASRNYLFGNRICVII